MTPINTIIIPRTAAKIEYSIRLFAVSIEIEIGVRLIQEYMGITQKDSTSGGGRPDNIP